MATNLLFPERDRFDESWIKSHESRYQFVDRCARPIYEEVRATINEVVSGLSDEHQDHMISRLKDQDRRLAEEAEFELVVLEIARTVCDQAGYTGLPADLSHSAGLYRMQTVERTVAGQYRCTEHL